MTVPTKAVTTAVALAFAAGVQAQSWTVAEIYRQGWSAEEMLDTEVRDANGEDIGEVEDIIVDANGAISKVVIETGGFFNIGDEHHGVPWDQVEIGPDMQWVQVPLREDNLEGFSLFRGEQVPMQSASWRVNELIGDYASLEDAPRYGLVTDVIFNDEGRAQGVVVDRGRGLWGERGRYAYPWTRYDERDRAGYPLPYRSDDVARFERFDYVELDRLSEYAGAPERRTQRGSAAGGGSSERDASQDQDRK